MVIKHDAHPLLLDKVSALFMGCAPSTLDMNSVYVCEYRRTGRHRFIGDTGLEVEDGNEVLDEREKEDEDGAAFVLKKDQVDKSGGGMFVTGGGAAKGGPGIPCRR